MNLDKHGPNHTFKNDRQGNSQVPDAAVLRKYIMNVIGFFPGTFLCLKH